MKLPDDFKRRLKQEFPDHANRLAAMSDEEIGEFVMQECKPMRSYMPPEIIDETKRIGFSALLIELRHEVAMDALREEYLGLRSQQPPQEKRGRAAG